MAGQTKTPRMSGAMAVDKKSVRLQAGGELVQGSGDGW
jgi:hypothetical protein